MISLKSLFSIHRAPSDGLTQGQREAIVDLLNYCSFVDHDIAQSEQDLIDDLPNKLHWDANADFDYYVNKSVAAVRNVLGGKEAEEDFLKAIRARLDSKESRAMALRLADKLFMSDDRAAPEECDAYLAIKKAIG